jgi:YVTN family beta-propeller protein
MRESFLGGAALLLVSAALSACGGENSSSGTGGSSSTSTTTDTGTGGSLSADDVMGALPRSCAFDCDGACTEPDKPYDCPTIKPWADVPHDAACGSWDGTFPAPVKGKCTSTDATADAAAKAGPIADGLVLPDGHRIRPAGRDVLLSEDDVNGGFPMSVLAIPGSRFALSTDGGIGDNALRLLDLDQLASNNGPPVKAHVAFPRPTAIFYGLAWVPPNRAFASGGGDGVIYAFDVDPMTGTLARAPSADVALAPVGGGAAYYAGAIAATADGQRLVIAPDDGTTEVRIVSLGKNDYGKPLGSVDAQSKQIFDLKLDPFDPSGTTVYATDEGAGKVYEIDAAKGMITRTIDVKKNPAQLAFLDAQYMVVAESDSDAIAIIDRAAGQVAAEQHVFEDKSPRGFSPTSLAYDAAAHRLYATLAGVNAVEAYDVSAAKPPAVTPAGRIPTAWWPTAVMADTDGSLVILNGKGHGTGTNGKKYPWAEGPITELLHGSVQHVPASLLSDLEPMSKVVDQNRHLADLPGQPAVNCPAGADDFPIPLDNTHGPSKMIKHVILIVRENKTYDGVMGDLEDIGDGDPSLIMASDTELQGKIWQNARAMAKTFVNFDNFYTDAEQSIQGHTWTVYGRTTDFMERSWLTIWGRGTRLVATPTLEVATPEEGGVFTWLKANKVGIDNMGEIIGHGDLDPSYPGFVYAQNRPDIDKSCYIGGRIRLKCDLKPFTYAVQSNDHTFGGLAGAAAPEVMIAVNDEATGLLLDALSHSPIWQDSLLIVTEDDPQDGGDHVDLHRSLLFMASPWVKRGYTSHGHYDMASVYKLVAHIFGIPYNNEQMKSALLPLDVFTSTPTYDPFDYKPRSVAAPCNDKKSKHAKAAERWDFEDLDDQPGLSDQITEMMREPRAQRGIRVVR